MVNRISYYTSFALALLLAREGHVKADVYVCGADYNDAVANCILNTECPLGDGCPTDTMCFAIPESECVGFTNLPPTLAPTLPDLYATMPAGLYVCGIDLDDALSRCRSADDACTNVTDTTAYCAVIDANVNRSCFIIPRESCPTDAPSSSPMWPTWTSSPIAVAQTAMATSPTVAPLTVTSPLPTVATPSATTTSPTAATQTTTTTSPTAVALIVTTKSPTVAVLLESSSPTPFATISTSLTASLPTTALGSKTPTFITTPPMASALMESTTDAKAGVEPSVEMSVAPTTSSPAVLLGSMTTLTDATTSPTPATLFVCGEDYSDAVNNVCGLTPCPNGDGCEEDLTCFAVPYTVCTPTISPSPTNTITFNPTIAPSHNTFFCGKEYDDALSSCSEATSCPTGAGCPDGMTCFAGISCAAPSTASALTAPPVMVMNAGSEAMANSAGVGFEVSPTISPSPTKQITFTTVAGTEPTASPNSSLLTSPTASPSTFFEATVAVLNTDLFCGKYYDDAMSSCSEATSCPTGAGCPDGMICYTGISCAAPSTASALTTKTLYCGDTYEDAVMNCTDRMPCPNGALDECPNGQTCFPIVTCKSPQSVVVMNAGSGMGPSMLSDTPVDEAETVKPGWEWPAFEAGLSSGSHSVKILLAKCIFLGGATVLVLF